MDEYSFTRSQRRMRKRSITKRCDEHHNQERRMAYVVVRTYSAGVHVGELVSRKAKEVTLKNARRIWYWKGANTLNEIALHGVGTGSKVAEPVAKIVLTEAIEIIDATESATANLRAAQWQK